ncbi:MAG: hypothetical protein AAGD14_01595 [Planctomycetota bacterium]
MRAKVLLFLCMSGAVLAQEDAQPEAAPQTLGLRITTVNDGPTVVVDRGEADGLAEGDRVTFRPRRGGTFTGTVTEVRDRSAVVELTDANTRLELGTRGDVTVPASRFAREKEPEPEPDDPEPDTPDHPGWTNKDENYKKGDPLLTEVPPVHPRQRARALQGRAYIYAALTEYLDQDFTNSYFRVGTDFTVSNVAGFGGMLRVNVEAAYLTEYDETEGWNFLVRRLSYLYGGTRFAPNRWEVGRFLHYTMPEFQVIDGVEYNHRFENGHSVGFSLGFLPEPIKNMPFNSDDIGLGVWYRFVNGPREEIEFRIGYQKTWHNTDADRDLIVGKFRWLPAAGWFVDAVVFLDIYSGSDELSGGGSAITYAFATVSKTWSTGNGLEVTYRHQEFPDIERFEFLPPDPQRYAEDKLDRVTLEGWRWFGRVTRVRGNLVGWVDQDDTGGAADLSIEWRDLFTDGFRLDVTAFVSVAKFEEVYGLRGTIGFNRPRYSVNLLYEISERHLDGFPPDRDDLIQHWVRLSTGIFVWETWDLDLFAEVIVFDEETNYSIGFNLTKRF